jgi:hypothetical protein
MLPRADTSSAGDVRVQLSERLDEMGTTPRVERIGGPRLGNEGAGLMDGLRHERTSCSAAHGETG